MKMQHPAWEGTQASDPGVPAADKRASAAAPDSWSLDVLDADLQVPRLEFPLADPVKYMDEHASKFGIHTRNVMHIAPQACSRSTEPSSVQSAAFCQLITVQGSDSLSCSSLAGFCRDGCGGGGGVAQVV